MKRILIVRLSAIGDVVMASPLAQAFKNTYPDCHVAWLVEDPSAEILRGNPSIDEIILWPRARWKNLLRSCRLPALTAELRSLLRGLRRKPAYDLVVDVQGLLKSAAWAFMARADVRLGLGSREGSRFVMHRVVPRSGASDRISSQYLLLAEDLGLVTNGFPMTVPTMSEDDRFADEFILDGGLDRGYVTISPFTTRAQKHWFEDRWSLVADRFKDQHGLVSVLLGGPGDLPAADRIARRSTEAVINMAGQTTLKQAAAVIRRSSLHAGVDTGLTHAGYALGTPTVALFGATRPYLDTDWMPGEVLYHQHECSPCRRDPTCEGDYSCMKAITVDEVMAAAAPLLKRGERKP